MKEDAKKLLRRQIRSSVADAASDVSIWQQVESLTEFSSAASVLVYWSMDTEVSTHAFIQRWADKKKICLPRVKGERLEIRVYSPDSLVKGYKGIMEPSADAPELQEVDLVIVPGMAFDRQGNRLGRGGGFYDRLLPGLTCPKVGVCRSTQLVEQVPVEPWDAKVDIVVTPVNCYICRL